MAKKSHKSGLLDPINISRNYLYTSRKRSEIWLRSPAAEKKNCLDSNFTYLRYLRCAGSKQTSGEVALLPETARGGRPPPGTLPGLSRGEGGSRTEPWPWPKYGDCWTRTVVELVEEADYPTTPVHHSREPAAITTLWSICIDMSPY